MEVLRTKHPEAQTPTAVSLDSYPGQTPGTHSVGHQQGYGYGGRRETLRGGRNREDRIRVPATLAPEVWRGKRGVEVDCWGLCRVAWEWAAPLGRLSDTHEWTADSAGQAARDQAGRGEGDLEEDDGKVSPEGGRTRGQGDL